MKTRIVLLIILVITLFVWFQSGAPNPLRPLRLGPSLQSTIEAPYKTEHAWASRAIIADISEMARYGTKGSDASFTETIVPWHPELFAAYASAQLGTVSDRREDDSSLGDQHPELLSLTVDALLKSSQTVSAALQRDMKDPRAHESAALTLAGFALLEGADGMSDTRWSLNRITAHLAMSLALREARTSPSIDGQLATVALLALTDRQAAALNALERIDTTMPAATAWQRALRMRITADWRKLTNLTDGSRLEKLMYWRARRVALRNTRAGQDLTDLHEPFAVDFARISADRPMSVEDGNDLIDRGLEGELDELAHVYRVMHQTELPAGLPAAILNARAGRLLDGGLPQVLPWGAWAEFANRHVAMWIWRLDYHQRVMLGSADQADQLKRRFDARLGHLTMYPVGSMFRTKGRRGTEADLSLIDGAVDVIIRAPELVTFTFWAFIENGTHYEPVLRGAPPKAAWFVPASADAPYDISLRAANTLGSLAPEAIAPLMDEAAHSSGLISAVAERHKANPQLMAKVRELSGPRVGFDMWAIDVAMAAARGADDRIALLQNACALTVGQCLELASELRSKDEAAAAAEYESAFADPSLDAVAMSWASRWLVLYYERHGQPAKALDLAQRSAAVGSAEGMLTLAVLYDRRSLFEAADELYSNVAGSYQSKPPLAAFLYRQAVVKNHSEYLERWRAIERELFPRGLQRMTAGTKTRPANGVFVERDSDSSRAAKVRTGDILIGLDGWTVDNLDQFEAILWMDLVANTHKFTAWRGEPFTVDLPSRHGMALKTYPLKGWIE